MSRWWRQESPIGFLYVLATEHGVRRISFGPGAADVVVDDAPDAVERRDRNIAHQLDEHFTGRRQSFSFDVDLSTVEAPLTLAIYETLRREVGWGETVSYGELAEMAGRPRAARAVGTAMSKNPIPIIVPCHRVVAAGGRIGGYGSSGVATKRALLALEGVTDLR